MTRRLRSRLTALLSAVLLMSVVACARQAGSAGAPPPPPIAARGWIDVEGGLLTIRAPLDGVIALVGVNEGDRVAAGQVLAVLNDATLRTQFAIARADITQATSQVDALRARVPRLIETAAHLQEAAREGAAAGDSAADASVAAQVAAAELRAAIANAALMRQRLHEAQRQLESVQLRARVNGLVVRRAVNVGDRVAASAAMPLFVLLPDAPLIVRAEVDEEFIDRIRVGMSADVVLESGAVAPHSARVLRISPVLGPSTLVDSPSERIDRRAVECVLQINGAPLRIGQRVVVRFGS